MTRLSSESLFTRLKPYLAVEQPNEEGEWDAYCPLHEDQTRSAQFNFDKRVFYCHAGCGGGTLDELLKQIASGRPSPAQRNGHKPTASPREPRRSPRTNASVAAWHSALMSNSDALRVLRRERGLTSHTIKTYELGWDKNTDSYTIPIKDAEGKLLSIRHYRPGATSEKKMWWERDMARPGVYPQSILESANALILCEGEMDALVANQFGFPAVTGLAGAATWKDSWCAPFKGKKVYIAYDRDLAGRKGARRVAQKLKAFAASIHLVKIPIKRKGADITDWFVVEGHTPEEFRQLLREAELYHRSVRDITAESPADINVLDSFKADLSGKPLRMLATVTGRRNPPYLVPAKVKIECTQDAGIQCQVCPVYARNGVMIHEILPHDEVVLRSVETNDKQLNTVLREAVGIPKCARFTLTQISKQSVEELYVRPSVDLIDDNTDADYTNRKIFSAGKHNTQPNQTVTIVGTPLPSPVTKRNEFLAWSVTTVDDSIEAFRMDKDLGRSLEIFRALPEERPLTRVKLIAQDLAHHVTRIVGRTNMHMAMDLVYHSALNFVFSGKAIGKGWMELLVVGDTRTGKSEAADKLIRHYGAGKLISCESASFAGIVGGLQQFGAGREWTITWGAVPLNDRRLVALDEVSGLTVEQISQMSSIRSSGTAQLTKIYSEQTFARTRLIWMSNPRKGRIADYTYGVHAIPPLIGNPEDIARFDLAMSVSTDDVESETINRARNGDGRQRYTSELCHALVLWVWSRTKEQIVWADGAQELVYKAAVKLGKRYEEDPPLIQAANVRTKIARLAVAIAARTFNTDPSYEQLIVEPRHVYDAVAFMDWIYSSPSFGYRSNSEEAAEGRAQAYANMDDAKHYLLSNPDLARFLRNARGTFKRDRVQDTLNLGRDEAQAMVHRLWQLGMVKPTDDDVKMEPMLHTLLRELR